MPLGSVQAAARINGNGFGSSGRVHGHLDGRAKITPSSRLHRGNAQCGARTYPWLQVQFDLLAEELKLVLGSRWQALRALRSGATPRPFTRTCQQMMATIHGRSPTPWASQSANDRSIYGVGTGSVQGMLEGLSGSERRHPGHLQWGDLRSTTSTPVLCQWLTVRTTQHGCGSAPSEHPKLIVD